MLASVAKFSTHKAGGAETDYEDAFRSNPDFFKNEDVPGDSLTIAVADGASESLLAGRWASLLVDEFVRDGQPLGGAEFAAMAVQAAAKWRGEQTAYVAEREARGKPIKWYEEPGLARGAHATLLVAHFTESGEWSAAALGDSCLFHVRGDRLEAAFPIEKASDFGLRPDLLGSRDPDEELIASRTCEISGSWQSEDLFYLCTDAVAAWFLGEHEAGRRPPWELLRDLGMSDGPDFESWIAESRATNTMRNDDVTLIQVVMW